MILEKFGVGWRNTFECKLERLFQILPDLRLVNVERFNGMLRIKIETLDNDIQYIVNCVVYKIERDSVRVCEECGKPTNGRRIELLPEPMSLCWTCYALTVDKLQSKNS